jgi:hypothetical protein
MVFTLIKAFLTINVPIYVDTALEALVGQFARFNDLGADQF